MRSERIAGMGLQLCLHHFGGGDSGWTVLLLHGFLDAGSTWDRVAEPLVAAGHRVVAPDQRGFGDSDRVGRGGYYHFPDYVADVDALVAHLQPEKLCLVGHSMGGTVATLFAGARPEAVDALALLEGVGPPATGPEATLTRTRRWLDGVAKLADPAPMDNFEAAVARLARFHGTLDDATLRSRARLLARELSDGRWRWKYDPLHRTTSPSRFDAEAFRGFCAAVTAPTLFISGGTTGWHPPDEAQRLEHFGHLETVVLEGAGHMLHWTQPDATGQTIVAFLARRT